MLGIIAQMEMSIMTQCGVVRYTKEIVFVRCIMTDAPDGDRMFQNAPRTLRDNL